MRLDRLSTTIGVCAQAAVAPAPGTRGTGNVVVRRVSLFVMIALAGLLLACLRAGEGAIIDLDSGFAGSPDSAGSSGPAVDADPPVDTLVFAVSAVNSPYASFAAYQRLAAYLAEDLGLQEKFVGNRTFSEIVSMVRSREATLALVCVAPYVFGQNEFGMEMIAVPMMDGRTSAKSYLIVREGSEATDWAELRGASFAFTDPLSYGGRLIPVSELQKHGATPESFFRRTIYTYSHDNSIEAVAKGIVDAATVNSIAYERALRRGAAEGTRVIWESATYPVAPVVVHPDLDPELKTRLRHLLLALDQSEAGRELLSDMGFDRFVVIADSEYDGIRELIRGLAGTGQR
jgi:phosphonate transport system substrate-binding protein